MRSSRRVRRSKRRVAISKRIVVRSSKSVQAQKKCNEVEKKCFPMKLRSKVSSISDVHERGTAMGAEILLVAAKGSHAVRLVRRQGCNRSWRNPEFQ